VLVEVPELERRGRTIWKTSASGLLRLEREGVRNEKEGLTVITLILLR
jgi:hypothetical protein